MRSLLSVVAVCCLFAVAGCTTSGTNATTDVNPGAVDDAAATCSGCPGAAKESSCSGAAPACSSSTDDADASLGSVSNGSPACSSSKAKSNCSGCPFSKKVSDG